MATRGMTDRADIRVSARISSAMSAGGSSRQGRSFRAPRRHLGVDIAGVIAVAVTPTGDSSALMDWQSEISAALAAP